MQESKYVDKQVECELWYLRHLDSGKDEKWYGMLLLGLGLDFTHTISCI